MTCYKNSAEPKSHCGDQAATLRLSLRRWEFPLGAGPTAPEGATLTSPGRSAASTPPRSCTPFPPARRHERVEVPIQEAFSAAPSPPMPRLPLLDFALTPGPYAWVMPAVKKGGGIVHVG